MPLDALVGLVLIVTAAWCALKVRATDRELRRRMTPRIALPRYQPPSGKPAGSGFDELNGEFTAGTLGSIAEIFFRPEWRRESHTADGAALVSRFWRLVAVTGVLALTGSLLITSAMR